MQASSCIFIKRNIVFFFTCVISLVADIPEHRVNPDLDFLMPFPLGSESMKSRSLRI